MHTCIFWETNKTKGRRTRLKQWGSISFAATSTGYSVVAELKELIYKTSTFPAIQTHTCVHMQEHTDTHVYKSCGHSVQWFREKNRIHASFFFTRVCPSSLNNRHKLDWETPQNISSSVHLYIDISVYEFHFKMTHPLWKSYGLTGTKWLLV